MYDLYVHVILQQIFFRITLQVLVHTAVVRPYSSRVGLKVCSYVLTWKLISAGDAERVDLYTTHVTRTATAAMSLFFFQ